MMKLTSIGGLILACVITLVSLEYVLDKLGRELGIMTLCFFLFTVLIGTVIFERKWKKAEEKEI